MSTMILRYIVIVAVLLLLLVRSSPAQSGDEASAKAAIEALNQEVVRLHGERRYEAAITAAKRSLDLASKTLGADHPETALSLDTLAFLNQTMGRYADAEPLYQRALKINEAKLGPDHLDTAQSLNNLAVLYGLMGRYTEAESLYRRALKIREARLGADHPHTALSLNNLAVLYGMMGRYAEAEPLYQRVLKLCETKLGADHPHTALSLNNLAVLYYSMGRYAEAEPLYQRSLKLSEKNLGPDHPDTALSLDNLASLYQAMSRYAEAEPLYQRALKIREAKLGADHPATALSLNNLAFLYGLMARYAEAEPLYRRSLKLREMKLGPDHPDTANSLDNLASLYQAMGRYGEAEPLFQRGLKIREAKLGADHPDIATSLNSVAWLYYSMGRYAESEPLFRRVLKIREAKLGADHPGTAFSLDTLASLYQAMGRYAESEPLYQRALKIREAKLGPEHPTTAISLNNLAVLYGVMGRYAEAEPLDRRTLKIRESKLGADHPDTAFSLHNLAVVYVLMGRYTEAEPLYQRALKIREAKLGADHPDTASSMNNLAWLYYSMGRSAEAEPLYRRVLKNRESKLGSDHPDTALSLNSLAELYRLTGRSAESEPLYQSALKIREVKLGADHPDTALSLSNLAVLHAEQGRWPEAVGGVDRARRSLLRHVRRVLPALAEKEQLTFLKHADESSLHIAFSLARLQATDPVASALSAGWVVNGKGLTQQTLAERALLARGDKDPAAAKAVAQLREVRGRLAALTLATPRRGEEDQRQREMAQLNDQERELSRVVGQVTGRAVGDDPWVELGAIRQFLPDDTVLIEIARFNVFDFQAKSLQKQWQAARYAVWVIPGAGGGEVRVIDLGPAQAIDEAVEAARAVLKIDPVALRDRGEPEVERQARGPLEALAKLVLTPLLPHIGPVKRWVVSPDAGLWLIPWAALPLDAEKYVIEKHEVRYVISGRDLAMTASQSGAGQGLVMADPDFGLEPGAALAATRAVLRGAVDPAPTELALRGTSSELLLGAVARLPGTAAEAKAIAPKLKSFTGTEPIVYTDRYALEAVFKAFQHPRAIIMSTHGFFLADQEAAPGDGRSRQLEGSPAPLLKSENPLLRCGLLLAGCNQGGSADGGEDGVLTGLEIVGTDLQGTELVVLSACETGLGQVRNGEGVAGLRQAFQLAGVQSVVATLWQIPDRESARLMTGFFDRLSKGIGKSEALRQAQLEQIASRRTRNGAAHPFFWAAYTLTGRGR